VNKLKWESEAEESRKSRQNYINIHKPTSKRVLKNKLFQIFGWIDKLIYVYRINKRHVFFCIY